MKKTLNIFFAFSMILSLAFIGDALSAQAQDTMQAQTGKVTVTRKRNGVATRTVRGGKYVGRKTVQGTKYVGRKTYQGGKYVGTKTVQGTKYTAHKTKRGAKAFTSRTKKIFN
jgi:hypothetical protein